MRVQWGRHKRITDAGDSDWEAAVSDRARIDDLVSLLGSMGMQPVYGPVKPRARPDEDPPRPPLAPAPPPRLSTWSGSGGGGGGVAEVTAGERMQPQGYGAVAAAAGSGLNDLVLSSRVQRLDARLQLLQRVATAGSGGPARPGARSGRSDAAAAAALGPVR